MQAVIGSGALHAPLSVPWWVALAWILILYCSLDLQALYLSSLILGLCWVFDDLFRIDLEAMEPQNVLHRRLVAMKAAFEGKETEQNWSQREQNVIKLRQYCSELTVRTEPIWLKTIKEMLDGLLKTVNSLRTTVSTNGCLFFQALAVECGPGIDNMVEILLQNFIKLCANTKPITRTNANDTVLAIISHVSYHIRVVQHIHSACQDKNVQPRRFACEWLKKVIKRHSRSTIEHYGGLDLIESSIKLGLEDRDKDVREAMRPTYWNFARRWPERSETMFSSLDKIKQDQLIADPSNPNPISPPSPSKANPAVKLSRSTGSAPSKPSLKEIKAQIVAQKNAQNAVEDSNATADNGQNEALAPTTSTSSTAPLPKPTLKEIKAQLAAQKKAKSSAEGSKPTMDIAQKETQVPKTGNLSAAPLRRKKAMTAKAGRMQPNETESEGPSSMAQTEAFTNEAAGSGNATHSPETEASRQRIAALSPQKHAGTLQDAALFLDHARARVSQRSLDQHGFRKLQILLREDSENPIYDTLVEPLCAWIETPASNVSSSEWQDVQTQALATLRLMLTNQLWVSTHYPRILSSLIATKQFYTAQGPMVVGIKKTLGFVINHCNLLECLHTVCSLMEIKHSESEEEIGLLSLGAMLHRIHNFDDLEAQFYCNLAEEQRIISRLGKIGTTGLKSEIASIRKAAIAFAQEFWHVAPKEDYFKLIAHGDVETQDLLKYYIARHVKIGDHIEL